MRRGCVGCSPLPPPSLLPRPRNPFGAASFPQASIPGEKRKLCFLLRSGESRASLSPGPGGTSRCYGGVVGCSCPPTHPPPPSPPPEVAVARSRSCLLRCLWDRGGLLGTASGSLVIYGRGGLIKESASVCTEPDERSPCAASLGEKGRRGTGSRGSEGVICWGARCSPCFPCFPRLLCCSEGKRLGAARLGRSGIGGRGSAARCALPRGGQRAPAAGLPGEGWGRAASIPHASSHPTRRPQTLIPRLYL